MCRTSILAFAVLASTAAATDLGFEPPLVLLLPEGTHPKLLLATDVTGDSDADLVVASFTAGAIVVRNGEGSFEFGASITTALPAPVDSWSAGDMNGDGAVDLVVRLRDENRVRTLLSDGEGAFVSGGALGFGSAKWRTLTLLDANEDGQLDAALFLDNALRLALGDGAGQLGALGPPIAGPSGGSAGFGLHALDVNGDAHADLAAVSTHSLGGQAWASYLGDGSGGFAKTPDEAVGVLDATTFDSCLGDVDGDGWQDLCISFTDFAFPGNLQLVYGTGRTMLGDYPDSCEPQLVEMGSVRIADLDGDGCGDLVAGPVEEFPLVRVLRGGRDGLQPPLSVALPHGADDVAIADLDLDGVQDVLVSQRTADAVTVLRNTALPQGWSDLGGALTGSAGTPTLAGSGALQASQLAQLQLTGAKPLAPVALVVGSSQVSLPFKGGELVPSPDVVLVGFTTDAAGALMLQARWPAGAPAGFAVWMQAWIADAAGPKGYTASNGLGAKSAP